MTFDDLNTFITLAQSKSFSRTADLLYTSQPTISFRIKNMEAQIGRPLIKRTTKHIELTPAGQDFLNYAVQIKQLYQEGLQAVGVNGFNYKVGIGAPESFWKNILFPALESYFLSHKEISFKIFADHSWVLNHMFIEGDLDVGISFIPVRHPNVIFEPLMKNPYVLVAHKNLAIPGHRLTPGNLSQFPLIYCYWGETFDEWFKATYCVRSHFIEVEKTWLFLRLLRNKMGVGFLPLRIAQHYLRKGEFVLLDFDHADTLPLEENYIIYNRRQIHRIQPIVDEIKRYVDINDLNFAHLSVEDFLTDQKWTTDASGGQTP